MKPVLLNFLLEFLAREKHYIYTGTEKAAQFVLDFFLST